MSATDVKWSHGAYDKIIATAANNGRVSVYDISRPDKELLWLHEHTRQVHTLGFNPFQGAYLLSGSHDGTVKYWDLRNQNREGSCFTLKSTKQFPGRAEAVRDLRWSPTDGVEFITCTDGGTIFKWDSRKTDRPELRINAHEKPCYAVDWHPDGRHVVSGSADKNIRIWDFKNSDKRQKPCFQFRVPQSIMNVRWRPPSWSATSHNTGDWESTQLAVGYNADDPRIHVWDLRRPLIPFRELDRYNSPATSLLWCSEDLLWTVGNEGMFTQTDVQHSRQPPEQISSYTANWLGTGEFAVFTEDRGRHHSINSKEPSGGFPTVIHDDVSSGEQITTSRSMTDDEGTHDHFPGLSYKRTHENRPSAKSVKSFGNTPPSRDDQNPVVPLDRAIFDKGNIFFDRQVGVIGKTTGAAVDLPTARFLTENYARPATEAERKQSPAKVLERLEEAFKINGDVCDQVSMYRLGQTWRILGAVILPELRAWADKLRHERLNQVSYQSLGRGAKNDNVRPEWQASPVESNKTAQISKGGIETAQTAKDDLLKEIVRNDWHKWTHDNESTSNMTTPIVRPMPDPSALISSKSVRASLGSDDNLEPSPLLPLSVVTAHSTAAVASHALKSDVDEDMATLAGAPEKVSVTDRAIRMPDSFSRSPVRRTKPKSAVPQIITSSTSDLDLEERRNGDRRRREQNRRRALLEYTAHGRPALSFDASFDELPQSAIPINLNRHDSVESLQMFSESTSSSHREKSIISSESMEGIYENQPSFTSEDLDYYQPESFDPASSHDDVDRVGRRTSGIRDNERSVSRSSNRSTSPFPDGPFDFEQPPSQPHIRTQGHPVSGSPGLPIRQKMLDRKLSLLPTADELQSSAYIYLDFQPIDVSSYYTNGHASPWSALPLISQAIEFDLSLGENHAQFSTHLLMHIHPFFFHRRFRNAKTSSNTSAAPQRLVDKLLQPHLSHRIIESIFQQHHNFLKSNSLHLPAAELRNLCVDLDIPSVYRPRLNPDEDPGTSLHDGFSLSITCTNPTCAAPLNISSSSPEFTEAMSCTRCNTPRTPCPICLSLRPLTRQSAPCQQTSATEITNLDARTSINITNLSTLPSLWTFCQSCGHSAHISCMQAWLSRPSTEGECPSAGCGHDCAPGQVRRTRIAGLAAAAAAAASVNNGREKLTSTDGKGRNGGGERKNSATASAVAADVPAGKTGKNASSSSSSMKDAWKAPQSAAVDRTRGLLLLRSSIGSPNTVGSLGSGIGSGMGGGTTGEEDGEGEAARRGSLGGDAVAGISVSGGGGGGGGGAPTAAVGPGAGTARKVVRLMTPREERPLTEEDEALFE